MNTSTACFIYGFIYSPSTLQGCVSSAAQAHILAPSPLKHSASQESTVRGLNTYWYIRRLILLIFFYFYFALRKKKKKGIKIRNYYNEGMPRHPKVRKISVLNLSSKLNEVTLTMHFY